jgi:hypothetical protein
VLPLLLFIPIALFVGTEASGSRAFIGVIVISLLPELVAGALARAVPRPVRLRSAFPQQRLPALPLAEGAS